MGHLSGHLEKQVVLNVTGHSREEKEGKVEGKKVDEKKKKSERRGRVGGCKWRDVSRGGRLRVEDRRLN